MRTPSFVKLEPGRWTGLPGTGCELWWDGDRAVVLARHGRGDDLLQEAEPAGGRVWQEPERFVRFVTEEVRPLVP